MSRSYRKISICGNTTAKSEKKDKRRYNKKLRRLNKLHLFDEITYIKRDVSDIWLHSKDGKQYFDAAKYPKLLRK